MLVAGAGVVAVGFGRLQFFSGWMDEFEKMVVRGIGEIIHQKMDLPPVIQSIHPVHPSIHVHFIDPSIHPAPESERQQLSWQ